MPKVVQRFEPPGLLARIERLALQPLWTEIEQILGTFNLLIEEKIDGNGGGAVRKLIDEQFRAAGGWKKGSSGEIDWSKCLTINGARVCLGVEVQVSARSDLMIVDICHIRDALMEGRIDLGLLVVPSDQFRPFLTDRVGGFKDAKIALDRICAQDHPVAIWGIAYDGTGPALGKSRPQYARNK